MCGVRDVMRGWFGLAWARWSMHTHRISKADFYVSWATTISLISLSASEPSPPAAAISTAIPGALFGSVHKPGVASGFRILATLRKPWLQLKLSSRKKHVANQQTMAHRVDDPAKMVSADRAHRPPNCHGSFPSQKSIHAPHEFCSQPFRPPFD